MLARRIYTPSSLRLYTTSSSSSASSSSSSAPLATQLITSAQAHIPTHGFTHQALKAGTPAHLTTTLDDYDWTINNLFPGGLVGETSVPVRLFRRWDADQAERAKKAAATTHTAASDGDEAVRILAAHMLEARLRLSDSVKMHLHEPLSQLSAVEIPTPLLTLLLARLPPPLSLVLPTSIPNPLPLLSRSFNLVDDLLNTSQAQLRRQQQRTTTTNTATPQQVKKEANDTAPDTYIPIYGSEWYTTRAHLALAYLASELHLISPASQGVEHSVGVLHSFLEHRFGAAAPSAQDPASSVSQLLRSGKEWIEWGGRGWVGILRSRGL